jgi:hypothetical protein
VSIRAQLDRLEELLLANNFLVTIALIDSTTTHKMDNVSYCRQCFIPSNMIDPGWQVCRDLMRVAQSKNKGCELLAARISHEVALASDEGTLFRANSAAPKLFSTFVRLVALPYLWHTLVIAVNMINANAIELAPEGDSSSGSSRSRSTVSRSKASRSGLSMSGSVFKRDTDAEGSGDGDLFKMGSMEIDPLKIDDASDAKINTLELWLVAQKLFRSIELSEPRVPLEIRRVIDQVHREIGDKFSSSCAVHSDGRVLLLALDLSCSPRSSHVRSAQGSRTSRTFSRLAIHDSLD